MTLRRLWVVATVVLCARPAVAQDAAMRRAVADYDALAYAEAIRDVRFALRGRLTAAEQARAFEILGFAYATLDSATQATDAFKQLLLLNPDRDLDPTRISPKITSLFALALGQVLVIRHFTADTTSFIGGTGDVAFDFTVSRAARVRTRIVGPAGELTVDSATRDGDTRVRWNGLFAADRPAAPGIYRVIVEAAAGRDRYDAAFPIRISAGAVDTTTHMRSLPGYPLLAETMIPARSIRPIALAGIAAAVVAGASLALENGRLDPGRRTPLIAVSAGTVLTGLLATLRHPAPVPAEANIRYNSLVRDQLARRNAEIAADNAVRLREVRFHVTAEPGQATAVAR